MADLARTIEGNSVWAGPAAGLTTFAESLVVVGFFVPATPLMLLIGGLLGATGSDTVWLIAWAIGGAFFGSSTSYLLGRQGGRAALRCWPFSKHSRATARARLFFHRYGMASIVLGRYLGPLQALIPFVAGAMQMDRRRFFAASAVSSIIWVAAMLAPGYLITAGTGLGAVLNSLTITL